MKNGALACVVEHTVQGEVRCMQLTSPTFLVAGLSTGAFVGWNLQTNSLDMLPAHQTAVTTLMLHNQFLVSGDACGFVKVFDISNFGVLLDGVCKPLPASQ